ncbi:hypothetical protein [Kitasatospora phosalacinea]|uniref:Uncharacterized protein n=1 Tax=Kitasatospora phosalacinea TaxID=2065 RepID=A0ABW6GKX7_9ACTN
MQQSDPSGTGGGQGGRGAAERARWIGSTLHRLTGRPPAVERLGGGGFRVTARVVEQPDAAVAAAVLRALGAGDRFGHRKGERWESLWAEVDPAPADLVPERGAAR